MSHRRPLPLSTLPRLLTTIGTIGTVLAFGARADHPREFSNPYADVQWEETSVFHGNLHTHTTYSDGLFAPYEVVDLYKKHGYHILALTDHDTDHFEARPAILYPWNDFAAIFEEIRHRTSTSWRWNRMDFGQFTGPWESRDPDQLGMLAVPGVEISRPHHIASLFCDYAGGTDSEETAFEEIARHGGLAVLLHPGRYQFEDDWYIDFYRRHSHLVGLEVYNQNDRYPEDREHWDRLLHELMPDRPVWGFAGDDMHELEHLAWNIMLFPLPHLATEPLRTSIETGAFFFYRPHHQMSPPSLEITRVTGAPQRIDLEIEGQIESVDWITFDPENGQSAVIHQGPAITIEDVPETAVYVRARIRGEQGTAYTQPFAVRPAIASALGAFQGAPLAKK